MTFTTDLIEAVLTHKEEIDQKITSASDHWRLNRIAVTDRNILRLAIAEIIVMKTPVAVAINEAIELGKQFGSEDSASFINGILGRVVRDGV